MLVTSTVANRTTLAAALEAWDAGLCVIPGRADGTKRPLGTWEEWQRRRPTREAVVRWFDKGHPALMVVCGEVSGVEMLELEGRAVAAGLADRIDARAHELGLGELLARVVAGYCERTPSDGLHVIYRCATIDPNTKLARSAAGEVLIETRGEGGVVMVAPSHGPTHATGLPWELTDGGFGTIATVTPDERDALFALMAEFDEAGDEPAAVVAPVPPRPVARWSGGVVGPSWVDAVAEHLAAEMTMRQRLERYGWVYVKSDQRGDLMRRPGDDKAQGISGRVNASGRLMNWSTSAPFAVAAGAHRPTHDQLDVIAAYEHRGDRHAAAREVAERTGIMEAWKRERDAGPVLAKRPTPPPGMDPETGELLAADGHTEANQGTFGNLPDAFWRERPELEHIHTAAHARSRSADAVFGCVLARVAAMVPPCWHLPAVVGAQATLSTYVALVGRSGAGKTSAKDVALDLLPPAPATVADDMPLGSGEGLIEVFFDIVDEPAPSGKGMVKVKRKVRDGAFLMLDEGQALAELGGRRGSTLLQNLRSAWTGTTLGNTNASAETKRKVPARSYTVGLVIGLQPSLASALLDDEAGGLPQRFVFVNTTDPTIPDDPVAWPGTLRFKAPPLVHHGGGLELATEVANEVRRNDLARQRGESTVDPLDAHGDLVRLKVAGCLAVLAGRTDIDPDDWRLAGVVCATSRAVRTTLVAAVQIEARKSDDARAAAAVRREALVADSSSGRALESMARSIGRAVRRHADDGRCAEGCAMRCARAATASKHRELVPIADAIERAAELHFVTVDGDRLRPGEGVPA